MTSQKIGPTGHFDNCSVLNCSTGQSSEGISLGSVRWCIWNSPVCWQGKSRDSDWEPGPLPICSFLRRHLWGIAILLRTPTPTVLFSACVPLIYLFTAQLLSGILRLLTWKGLPLSTYGWRNRGPENKLHSSDRGRVSSPEPGHNFSVPLPATSVETHLVNRIT